MERLYPLLMQPAFDPRPWGTFDLSPIYPNHKFEQKIGEAWLTGDDCKVANGPLAGQTLAQISAKFQRELVGETAPDAARFPLLLKFLFPHEKLSLQVHPDDEQARRVGEPWGKTECWYVAHAKPGAQIALGMKPGVTAAQFEKSIREKRAEELLNWINIYAGDMIYVSGGTVHTLGPGSVIIETQQQSDTTYRLYDYGRPRELHLDKAVQVAFTEASSPTSLMLPIDCEYFHTELARTTSSLLYKPEPTRFHLVTFISGMGTIAGQPFREGEAWLVPAGAAPFEIEPEDPVKFLRTWVP